MSELGLTPKPEEGTGGWSDVKHKSVQWVGLLGHRSTGQESWLSWSDDSVLSQRHGKNGTRKEISSQIPSQVPANSQTPKQSSYRETTCCCYCCWYDLALGLWEIPQVHLYPNIQIDIQIITHRDHKDGKPWLLWHPPCRLREKRGFVWDVMCTAQFVTFWPQTISLLPSAMNVLARGGGKREDSHKLPIVLPGRGQKSYGWN